MAEHVASAILLQVVDVPALIAVGGIVMLFGLVALGYLAGRRASSGGLVGIGLGIAAWYGFMYVVPYLLQPPA